MKKLAFIGILGSLIIVSCKTIYIPPYLPKPISTDTISTTLNGYSQDEALKQIAYSDATVERRPVNTQFWFSKDIICNIKALLDDECKSCVKPDGIKPDGIRIYFSRVEESVGAPLGENNGIMIVSTYHLTDIVTNGVTEHIHQDYFNHAKSAALFNMKDSYGNIIDIHGKPSHDNDITNGALLLSGSPRGPQNSCPLISEHDIPRDMAEEMVWRFPKRWILRPGKINARAEWFDIKMIYNLVTMLNQQGEDGVRIYFSRGTTKYKPSSVRSKKDYSQNKTKFILVTTTAAASGKHLDDLDCSHREKLPLFDNAKDNGELCPTHCNGTIPPTN